MKKKIKKRSIVQLIFFIIAVGVTINHTLIENGMGISWLSSGYIHYVCPICGVTTIYQYFASSADWITKLLNPVSFVIIISIIMAIFFGPIFCGWICPFGAYQDFIAKIFGPKVAKKKYNKLINKNIDTKLRYLRYVFLLLVIYMTAKSAITVLESINPYHALLNLFVGEFAIIGLIVLVIITLASLFIHRPWCKYLCPYGAFLGIFNVFRIKAIVRDKSTCIGCKKCDRACPMNIKVASSEVVRDHQCISCLECISNNACPVDNTVNLKGTKGIDEKVELNFRNIAAFTITLVSLIVISINIALNKTGDGGFYFDSFSTVLQLDGNYESGTYTGLSTGFNTGMVVEVTIDNNQITNIDITSHNETIGYYETAFETIPSSIISSQSTEVDTVSGATRSSEGIIDAVNDALSQAKISSGSNNENSTSENGNENAHTNQETNQNLNSENSNNIDTGDHQAPPSNDDDTSSSDSQNPHPSTDDDAGSSDSQAPSPSTGDAPADSSDAQAPSPSSNEETDKPSDTDHAAEDVTTPEETGNYADGVYTGSANGYGGLLTIEVTIENGEIAAIEITEDRETPRFLQHAIAVITSIIDTQSTDVDTVSGATISSRAIINATEEALEDAD